MATCSDRMLLDWLPAPRLPAAHASPLVFWEFLSLLVLSAFSSLPIAPALSPSLPNTPLLPPSLLLQSCGLFPPAPCFL